MICEGGGKATKIFIGDISSVIFQSQRSSVSLGLLDRLVHAGINVVFCDRRMFPYSMLVPFAGSGDSAGKLREQLLWTDRDCDRVWKKIVSDKISSQTRLLGYFGISVVPEYQVADGDAENAEGNFARYYFSKLFGTTFRRHIADDVNGALDYGYTVLLSHMARIISSRGYSLQLGVHHRGARNNFNLACDVMEPFRPLNKTARLFDDTAFRLLQSERGECIGTLRIYEDRRNNTGNDRNQDHRDNGKDIPQYAFAELRGG